MTKPHISHKYAMPNPPGHSSDEHVAALDIAVHDPQLVHVLQRHTQLGHPILSFPHGELQLIPGKALPMPKHL